LLSSCRTDCESTPGLGAAVEVSSASGVSLETVTPAEGAVASGEGDGSIGKKLRRLVGTGVGDTGDRRFEEEGAGAAESFSTSLDGFFSTFLSCGDGEDRSRYVKESRMPVVEKRRSI
jgi:hypothetical protein